MTRPRIRRAMPSDIPVLAAMFVEAHARSTYADLCSVNERSAKGVLTTLLQRHGGQTGGTFCAVADQDGEVVGTLLATSQPFYFVTDAIEVTDVFIYVRPKANAHCALRLNRAFHRWAASLKKRIVIRQGSSSAIVPSEKSDAIFKRLGMIKTGSIHEKWIDA